MAIDTIVIIKYYLLLELDYQDPLFDAHLLLISIEKKKINLIILFL
jgi:hypothetical protein